MTTTTATETAKPPAQARPGLGRFLPLFVLIALAAGYGGYRFYLARKPYEWSGTVEARTITVGSRTGGRVKEVLAHEGQNVEANQVLVKLEVGDLEAQRLVAKAQLVQSQANLDKLRHGARPEEIEEAKARAQNANAALQEQQAGARHEQIDGARARLAVADAALEKAKIDADRSRQLIATGAISRAELDTSVSAEKGALAQRDAARHAFDELEHGSRREDIAQASARASEAKASARLVEAGTREEDVRVAEAQVEAAQGRLDQVLVMIDELAIKAPRAARIESLDLRAGDILGVNQAAAILLENDQLYVRIYVPETQIGRVKIGESVPVTVDSFPDRSFNGTVEHVNTVGEYSPRNLQTADERADQVFAMRIGLTEGRDVLKAGMAAFIHVPK